MMMSSTTTLRMLSRQKSDGKKLKKYQSAAQADELTLAVQEIRNMKECYDCLLSAAAATANSAYEFSQSLRDLGACLLEKTAFNENEESAKVVLMLGRVQFELHKIVDTYRSHIFKTIITPSESLLNELHKVEEMKRLCDEKRSIYEQMVAEQRENRRSKSWKLRNSTSEQLQCVYDECEEEATLCMFRVKSLRQGHARSLLTLGAHHHAAQLNLFRKGFNFLGALAQDVRMISQQNHIDYPFSELHEVSMSDDDDSVGVTFDYRYVSSGPDAAVMWAEEENRKPETLQPHAQYGSENKNASHSAPIITAGSKLGTSNLVRNQSSSRSQPRTYVLPTPVNARTRLTATECAPMASPHASPRFSIPPRETRFHELRPPPTSSSTQMPKSPITSVHSAPLAYKNPEISMPNKASPSVQVFASPLPTPPPSTSLPNSSTISPQQYFTC